MLTQKELLLKRRQRNDLKKDWYHLVNIYYHYGIRIAPGSRKK